jgi:hypothetical protein
MNVITDFLLKYKVFLLGLLGAIGVSLQELLTTNAGTVDFKVYGFALLMAILSYFANQWRGQGVTILGVLGTLSGVFVSMQQVGGFTWSQFIVLSLAAILSAVASPAKPATYENNKTIVDAKKIPADTKTQAPIQTP